MVVALSGRLTPAIPMPSAAICWLPAAFAAALPTRRRVIALCALWRCRALLARLFCRCPGCDSSPSLRGTGVGAPPRPCRVQASAAAALRRLDTTLLRWARCGTAVRAPPRPPLPGGRHPSTDVPRHCPRCRVLFRRCPGFVSSPSPRGIVMDAPPRHSPAAGASPTVGSSHGFIARCFVRRLMHVSPSKALMMRVVASVAP